MIQKTDVSQQEILIALVVQINVIAPSTTAANTTTNPPSSDPTTTDTLLQTVGTPYEEILHSVWAAHHHDTVVTSPRIGNLEGKKLIQWEKKVNALVITK